LLPFEQRFGQQEKVQGFLQEHLLQSGKQQVSPPEQAMMTPYRMRDKDGGLPEPI